jgi:hypothetical protein
MPTLQELQAAEAAHGGTRLRTLMLEFADTLTRLPKLRQEVETWMQTPGVDWSDLAQRLEPQLAAAADWLLDYDMLGAAAQDNATLKDFMQRAMASTTSRTVAAVVAKYNEAKLDAGKNPTSPELAKHGYVDHGNGTLTDSKTGLMWKRVGEGKFTWDEAIKFDGKDKVVRFGGFSDWRLPTIDELKSLLLPSAPYVCEAAFSNSREWFWSSSPSVDSLAWYVNFGDGNVSYYDRGGAFAVRLVRASQ